MLDPNSNYKNIYQHILKTITADKTSLFQHIFRKTQTDTDGQWNIIVISSKFDKAKEWLINSLDSITTVTDKYKPGEILFYPTPCIKFRNTFSFFPVSSTVFSINISFFKKLTEIDKSFHYQSTVFSISAII